jgi:glycosyltransferase involved in cell wall biosynthesis
MPAMRIGFDARAAFLDPRRGFGRVTRCLADALLEHLPGEVVLFVPQGVQVPARWYPLAARIVQLRRPRRGAFLVDGPAWRWTLAHHPVDVIHLPAWGVPPGIQVPVVATFYDATPFRFRSPPGRWRRRRACMAIRSLVRADAVHAISSHARAELLAVTTAPADCVTVVPLGAAPPFCTVSRPAPPAHLLFVGGAERHKNLALLLAVVPRLAAEGVPPLVVVGPARDRQALAHMVSDAAANDLVRFVWSPPDDELAALYQHAFALLLPSRNEGFGLPALEAMACGCPVIAARAGALPEVVGGAGVLLDPDAPAVWREAVRALLRDPAQRDALARAGLERAAQFSWSKAAAGLADIYGRAASAASRART